MNSILEISNFGAIRSAKIEVKPITILIGEQAEGKSTIAKLIAIFNDIDSFSFNEDDIEIDFNKALQKYNIHNYLHQNTEIKFKSVFFEFEFKNEINITTSPVFNQKHAYIRFLDNSFKEMENISENIKNDDRTKLIEHIEALYKNPDSKLFIKKLEESRLLKVFNSSIYIPTERFLISILNNSAIEFMNSSLTLPKSVTQFGVYYQMAKEGLRKKYNSTKKDLRMFKSSLNLEIDFLNVSYSNSNGTDSIKSKSKELALQESASGYQSVVPLFLVMKYFADEFDNESLTIGEKTFIIEEPELNLYPKTQNRLVNVLAKFANLHNNNLVITSHSPYILTSFNNLLFAHQISKKTTSNLKEISNVIPQESWIDSSKFSAYHIEKGKAKSIFDKNEGLIKETELDSASEIIMGNFNTLMSIYKKKR